MGNNKVKRALGKMDPQIKSLQTAPLGQMLGYWSNNLRTKGKKKQQMIKYCCHIWIQGPILKLAFFWPRFGSAEDWVCQLLN
jgi:hypothetical protein